MANNRDIFNTKINVGDKVAFNPPTYKGLVTGTVLKETDKRWKVGFYRSEYGRQDSCFVRPTDLVVKPKRLEVNTSALPEEFYERLTTEGE